MTDPEKWLDDNTITCKRFAARMTPGACSDYRKNNPERCKGCPQTDKDIPRVEQWATVQHPSNESRKENEEMSKPVRICAKCKESKPMNGRGLCGTCYHAEAKAGTLDVNYPAGVKGKPLTPKVEAPPVLIATAPAAPANKDIAGAILELLFPNGISARRLMQGVEVAKDVEQLIRKAGGMQ